MLLTLQYCFSFMISRIVATFYSLIHQRIHNKKYNIFSQKLNKKIKKRNIFDNFQKKLARRKHEPLFLLHHRTEFESHVSVTRLD
jgi:hypothetical protein